MSFPALVSIPVSTMDRQENRFNTIVIQDKNKKNTKQTIEKSDFHFTLDESRMNSGEIHMLEELIPIEDDVSISAPRMTQGEEMGVE